MQPDFEDLKRRIALSETGDGGGSKFSRLEEIVDRMPGGEGSAHRDLEELCGYADGMLRRKRPERWRRVHDHIKECTECQGEVKQLRAAVPLPGRLAEPTVGALWRIGETFRREGGPDIPPWTKFAVVSALLIAVLGGGSGIAGHKIGSAEATAKAEVYKEQFEKLSKEIEKLRRENAELRADFKRQFVTSQPILPKEGVKPSSLYTPQENPSPSSKAVYTPSS